MVAIMGLFEVEVPVIQALELINVAPKVAALFNLPLS